MRKFNIKSPSRLCAFCRHWYDPTNSAISPSDIRGGFWNYDEKAVHKCAKNGRDMKGQMSCHLYECKL